MHRGTARSGLRVHGTAVAVTLLVGAALLVTREAVVALLAALGWTSLLPLAEELFAAPAAAGGDKLVHALLFFVQTAVLVRSFGAGSLALAGAAGLSLMYGAALELIQGAIGRNADPWDLLANGIGIGLCVAWRLARRER